MQLSDQDRVELQAVLKSDVYDGSVSSRAQIVLRHGEGRPKNEIAAVLRTSRPTVDKWIRRYQDHGIWYSGSGKSNVAGRGPRQIPDRIRSVVLDPDESYPTGGAGNIALVVVGDVQVH